MDNIRPKIREAPPHQQLHHGRRSDRPCWYRCPKGQGQGRCECGAGRAATTRLIHTRPTTRLNLNGSGEYFYTAAENYVESLNGTVPLWVLGFESAAEQADYNANAARIMRRRARAGPQTTKPVGKASKSKAETPPSKEDAAHARPISLNPLLKP